jgi:hypothetical protein
MTVAMETFNFGWIGSFGCSLHSQIVDGIVKDITGIALP